ncbi:unnamed protein product [Brassica napus]|uniref:(rape) hypothetical protein n=1 Tax=Brassica napus TaxID=3708 RepID=A0A816W6K6_BRANA|nr:unnamed protein product [Brassica napus]
MTLSSVSLQFPICSPIRKKLRISYIHTHKRTESHVCKRHIVLLCSVFIIIRSGSLSRLLLAIKWES